MGRDAGDWSARKVYGNGEDAGCGECAGGEYGNSRARNNGKRHDGLDWNLDRNGTHTHGKLEAMKVSRPIISNAPDPVEYWDQLLGPLLKKSPDFPKKFLAELRGARLIFGKRVLCPFLRPFFLSPADEERVRRVAETIASVAERVTSAAMEDQQLFKQFFLRPEG